MKKFALILSILMICSVSASAGIYNSPFGFSINVPSDWEIISGKEVEDWVDYETLKFVKKHAYTDDIKRRIRKGEVELYIPGRQIIGDTPWDAVYVTKFNKDFLSLLQECNGLSNKLSKVFGRPIEVYECGYKKMGNLQGFFEESDGPRYEQRVMAFYFLNTRNEMIGIGGACKNRTLKVFRKEHEDIIRSIRIQ